MDATFLSCSLPLPDSIGSVFNLEQDTHHPMVFRNCILSPRGSYTSIHTYVAINPIGFSKNSIMVYKAAVITTTAFSSSSSTRAFEDKFYALKVADDDNPESILMLKEEVRRSEAMKNWFHENLLGIFSYFMDEQSKKFCVVVRPHFPGSLRTIMKNRFPQGFPEDLILSVLRSVLNALKFLHGQQIMHGDINAGHVYLCDNKFYSENPYLIKLGFAASVYEDDDEMEMKNNSCSSFLPMSCMSKWGAAPEVYYGNQSYPEKADIWLVGITALELAYGGLKVSNRNTLEAMIKEINLPPSKKAKAAKMFKYYVKKLLPLFSSSSSSKSNVNVDDEELVLPLLSSKDDDEDYCPLFSESFTAMVMQCLAWDPEKRPSVDRLLSHPFFTNTNSLHRKDGPYFYDALMNKTSSSSS